MQKVSLSFEFQRSSFLACLGEILCFRDCHNIISLHRFANSLFGMLECTLIHKFATSILMKRALRCMLVIRRFSFWTLTLLERRNTSAGCLLLKDPYLSGFLYSRSSFLESWTENPFFSCGFTPLLGVVLPDSSPLEHCPFVVHCTESPIFLFPLPSDLPFGHKRAFQGVSHENCFSRVLCSK